MSGRSPLLLMIAACLMLGGIFYYYYYTHLRDKYDWRDAWPRKAYGETDRQPYGSLIAHQLLSGYFPGKPLTDIQKKLSAELPADSAQHYNYVFIGEGMFMDSADTEHLLQFVARGNTALLVSKSVPFDLMFQVYYIGCRDADWTEYAAVRDTQVEMQIPLPEGKTDSVPMYFAVANRHTAYDWQYIPAHYFCGELPHRPIGYFADSLINFALFRYGKGQFLLHSNPIVFSNYTLLRPEARPYAETLLSWLPEGPIYWDAVNRVPEMVARRANANRYNNHAALPDEHLLTYVLQQPALAWAWYLLLGLTGLWFIFKAKRRQRVIPILPRNENSSYEFISTIANLHFRERNYDGISIQKMKLFLAQVRDRYGLHANLNPITHALRAEHDFFKRLAAVSEVPESEIHDIFTQYANCVQYQTQEQMMTELHLAIEAFWKRAR